MIHPAGEAKSKESLFKRHRLDQGTPTVCDEARRLQRQTEPGKAGENTGKVGWSRAGEAGSRNQSGRQRGRVLHTKET